MYAKYLHVLVLLYYLSDESHSQRCASRYFHVALTISSIFKPRKDLVRRSSWPHKFPTFQELFSADICRLKGCLDIIPIVYLLLLHEFAPSWGQMAWKNHITRFITLLLQESNKRVRYMVDNNGCKCGHACECDWIVRTRLRSASNNLH